MTTPKLERWEADPRIGTSDVDTWRAVPWESIEREEGIGRGGYCIVAGDCDEADVYIEVTGEYPQHIAEFIVEAVQEKWARIKEAGQA